MAASSETITAFCSGTVGAILIGLDASIDPKPNPPILTIKFDHNPKGMVADNLLFSTGGLIDVLRGLTGGMVSSQNIEIKWTEEARNGLHTWFRQLISLGFNQSSIERFANTLSLVHVGGGHQGATRLRSGFGAMPDGSVIQINNLEKCYPNKWDELRKIPGVFTLTTSGMQMPITGTWARDYIATRHQYPSPCYVSAVHVNRLSEIFPAVALERDKIRADMGYDYPSYPPAAFPIPGVNPDTGLPMVAHNYQADAVSKFLAMKREFFYHQPGLGKTVSALLAAETEFQKGNIDLCVIFVPRSVLGQWQRFIQYAFRRQCVVIEGGPDERKKLYIHAAMSRIPYIVMKYESARLPDAVTHLWPLVNNRTMVVIDEIHNFRHYDAKRYRAIRYLLDGIRYTDATFSREVQDRRLVVPYRLFLTGTPNFNNTTNNYAQMQLLGYRIWNNEGEFNRAYFETETIRTRQIDKRTGQNKEVERVVRMNPSRVPQLQEIMATVGHKMTRDDAGIEMPELARFSTGITPTGLEAQVYDAIRGQITKLVKKVEEEVKYGRVTGTIMQELQHNLLATLTMERLFSADPALIVLSDSPTAQQLKASIGVQNFIALSPGSKMVALIQLMNKFLQGTDKVVVFCNFPKIFDVIKALFIKQPRGLLDEDEIETLRWMQATSLFFSGDNTDKQREEIINEFKNNPNKRILFMSTLAGGIGLNLQTAANYVIHFDQPFAPGQLEQAEDRVYRQGQKKPVVINRLIYAPAEDFAKLLPTMSTTINQSMFVDARVRNLLMGKIEESDLLLDY